MLVLLPQPDGQTLAATVDVHSGAVLTLGRLPMLFQQVPPLRGLGIVLHESPGRFYDASCRHQLPEINNVDLLALISLLYL